MKRGPRAAATAILLAACAAALLWLRGGAVSAAEEVTWGASDPAWSPDGRRLAISLFGSVWTIPAEGGPATRVTMSPGYHAHPAWSPDGARIAFVRGAQSPRSRTLNVPGRLVVADAATGRERDVPTPWAINGTLAWSPDGSAIVAGLATPDGSYLHRIGVERGGIRRLQFALSDNMRSTSKIPDWVDVTGNAKSDALFFAGFRTGTPQIWSMPAGDPPIAIQLPLTRYRPEDALSLRSLSATPDGRSVIFSASLENAKGDFDLYRVASGGGTPVAISHYARDEFTPAVSPDGRLVAHVSNRSGNIDIYTVPIEGGEQRHIPISELRFGAPSGRVRIRVLDEFGQPTPARVYVRAADGKAYSPAGTPIHYYPLEPRGLREGFFIGRGEDVLPAPAGALRVTVRKGLEYRVAEARADVAPDETVLVTVALERWTNWAQKGWYTGENHVHPNYGGSYYVRPEQSLRWMMAEDLNAVNMAVSNSFGALLHDKEFFRGSLDPVSNERYLLSYGQEYRNNYPYGHMMFLNLKRLVLPGYSSFPGSAAPYDFPLNTTAAGQARAQGGLVSYAHPISGQNDPFDRMNGARELPIAAAAGAIDSIDVLPYGRSAYEVWYRFLNCGFHLAPGAGTDAFTNYRGMNEVPGEARQYVDVGGPLRWPLWIERYREGRNFVTTGPLLRFTVNGQPMGSVIPVPRDQPYSARLVAEVESDTPIRTVEFVRIGHVIDSVTLTGNERRLRREKEVTVSRSAWFAVRVTAEPLRGGPEISEAHSGAIYVEAGRRPVLVRGDVELMLRWIDRLWAYLLERNNFGTASNRRQIETAFETARAHYRGLLASAE